MANGLHHASFGSDIGRVDDSMSRLKRDFCASCQAMRGNTMSFFLLCEQVQQAKKRLLDKMQADVAAAEDTKLKRILQEDESTAKRREELPTTGSNCCARLLRKSSAVRLLRGHAYA